MARFRCLQVHILLSGLAACGPSGPPQLAVTATVEQVDPCGPPEFVVAVQTDPGVKVELGEVASATADATGAATLRLPADWEGRAEVVADNGSFRQTDVLRAPLTVVHTAQAGGWHNECKQPGARRACTFSTLGTVFVNMAPDSASFVIGGSVVEAGAISSEPTIASVQDWDLAVFEKPGECPHLAVPVTGTFAEDPEHVREMVGEVWFGLADARKTMVLAVGNAARLGPWPAPVTGDATLVFSVLGKRLKHKATHGDLQRPTDARYVAIMTRESQRVRECGTYRSEDGHTLKGAVVRQDLVTRITERATGKVVAEKRFRGPTRSCAQVIYSANFGAQTTPPPYETALRWIERTARSL